MSWKRTFRVILAFFAFFIVSELYLRFYWGFCDAVLFRRDKDFEYIQVAGQDRFRFRKHSFYNQYSQRNKEITHQDSIVIDGFGDSVLNGGALTDQDSLATTLLSAYLSGKNEKKLTVLNIAAPSWGPDNCYAYLKKYGDFNCKKMFLVVSSHDAFDDMTFPDNVIDENHPDKEYKLAWAEMLDRYILPRIIRNERPPAAEHLFINKRTKNAPFNSGFADFFNYCSKKKIPLLIYLHAERGERISRQYNYQGKLIIEFCRLHNIALIKDMDYNIPNSAYRDEIHFNESGQKYMFSILKGYL